MRELIHENVDNVAREHIQGKEGYEYFRRQLIPMGGADRCCVTMCEIPPGKSAFPYHYHVKNEEVFYILSGSGILRTPVGERQVKAGDYLFFPANEKGAHKLTNPSETDMLIYLDFDTHSDLEVAFYPDSGKLGVWGKDINRLYRVEDSVEYFEGE